MGVRGLEKEKTPEGTPQNPSTSFIREQKRDEVEIVCRPERVGTDPENAVGLVKSLDLVLGKRDFFSIPSEVWTVDLCTQGKSRRLCHQYYRLPQRV